MEISHDIHDWLVACGFIETIKSIKTLESHSVMLNEDTIYKFKNVDIYKLALNLEDLYNKFNKSKLNYSQKLYN